MAGAPVSLLDLSSLDSTACIREHQSVNRVLSSRHFAKAPLLSSFLSYVCRRVFEDGQARISEYEIAINVFRRSPEFDPREDNIVRTYARHLRGRLHHYYANEGQDDPIRIAIPKGGYVPVFSVRAIEEAALESSTSLLTPKPLPEMQPSQVRSSLRPSISLTTALLLLITYSTALVGIAWFTARRLHTASPDPGRAKSLWTALFAGANIYIVPADAGFNLLQEMSHHPLPLADYMKGTAFNLSLPNLDSHSSEDIRTQEFTSFIDLQIVAALERLPDFDPQRAILCFPRDLHLDDLKNANVVILGSEASNPWAALAESNANFRIVNWDSMQSATVINAKPRPGEAASYISHWNEPAHETFGVIAYLPNLGGTGHLLLLQGLDVAGTQAAAETLFHPALIAPILRRATRPDGSLRSFEILLRSTSIQSNATGTQVIASRIY